MQSDVFAHEGLVVGNTSVHRESSSGESSADPSVLRSPFIVQIVIKTGLECLSQVRFFL